MSVTTIALAFVSYQRKVMDPRCHPTQVQECKRAFFAGAWAALTSMTFEIAAIEDDDQSEAALAALLLECDQFSREVEDGRQ
jgi:hypothetical protein